MRALFFTLLLSLAYGLHLRAENLTGIVCDETNAPIKGVNVTIRTSKGGKIIAATLTTDKGYFILSDIEAGKYTLLCSHVGYSEYTADLQVPRGQDIELGKVILFEKNTQLNETHIVASRNVFTTNKQNIYPSDQQIEASGDGLDLLKKLPIPLLQVNPISRTVSSLDPLGGVALFINDIPAEANDLAVLVPKQIKRVEVIRNPGTKYGSNLAIAINFVLKQARNGVTLGMNTSNSTQTVYGYNNIFATYNHKNSQLSINQSENYQNYSHLTSEDLRQYFLPDEGWHTIQTRSLYARTLSATHGTTLKYNLTQPDRYVLQLQGYMYTQRNPKQNNTYLVSETGKDDYTSHTRSRNEYDSPALNLYFRKFLPHRQSLIINVVGTYIHSNYDYLYTLTDEDFRTAYEIKGRKASSIGEIKYCKDIKWGSLTSGLRSFYGNTRNNYTGSTDSRTKMINANSNAYIQMDGRWKRLSGNVSLSLNDQYYTQDKEKYHKLSFTPQANLNYSLPSSVSLGYQFNLASRLPSLASMNDIVIQKDQWERSVGNPYLTPFNHIENSLKATYYKSNLYAMLSAIYASNKKAIMPTITRTITDEWVFFDNGVQNQRNMNQLVLTAYLHYEAFSNKLVVSGYGSYNFFHARSHLYSNKRSFFSGLLNVESYLGWFYLSANVSSRSNSLFAETIWYNEYSSSLSATYSWKTLKVGLTWEQPFQRGGTNNRVETTNNVVHKVVRNCNPEVGSHILLTCSWTWNYGIKSKAQEADLNNKDTDAGILK